MAFYKVRKYRTVPGNAEAPIGYYATNSSVGSMDANDVAEYVAKRSGVSVGQIRGLLTDISEVISEAMLRGENVDLGNLGVLQIKCSSKSALTPEELQPTFIREVYPHLRMRKKLKSKINNIRFTKAKYTTAAPKSVSESEEEPEGPIL